MTVTTRPYQAEEDFWSMRRLLRRVLLLNNLLQLSWHVALLEYTRWHVCLNCVNVGLEDVVHLWESDGELIAILMPGPGEAHLMIHPSHQRPQLEAQMLAVAEERLAGRTSAGVSRLVVWAPHSDQQCQAVLTSRGYAKHGPPESQWRRKLDQPTPWFPSPEGTRYEPWAMDWSCWSAATHQAWASTRAISRRRPTTGPIPPGIGTSRPLRSTAETWVWWRSPQMGRSARFAPSGLMM